MNQDLLYQLALTEVPHIGHVHARILVQAFGSAEAIFKAGKKQLESLEGIGEVRARAIKHFQDYKNAETEIRFIEKYKIKPLFISDKDYPARLLHCYDPPTLLFYKGNADLNSSKIISVIGTRNHTEYGKHITESLIRDLADHSIVIVSGMAFGIDAIAHKAAIKNKLPTIGVLAHGLDQIYPAEHANLAKEMLKKDGGLLTEFRMNTKPDKHNFPTRNRIVAGLSDATIVIETDLKGGSMITAELANGYNKDVFACPGKINDKKSSGCNYLIKTNKANLLTQADEIIELLGWEEKLKTIKIKQQRELFVELTREEKTVADILVEKDTTSIDEINFRSGLSSSTVAAAILNMELRGIVASLPGKLYKLV